MGRPMSDMNPRAEAYRRYQGDTDVFTGDPVDDWGYTDCQREAFIAGAEWAVAQLEPKDQ